MQVNEQREDSGSLFRFAARSPGPARDGGTAGRQHAWARCATSCIASSPRHAEALARGRALRGAVNQVMGDDAAAVPEGAEVAFFPPVTGG